jgi:hypothetical protein
MQVRVLIILGSAIGVTAARQKIQKLKSGDLSNYH